MTPMLARTYGPRFSRFPVYVQPKLNGVRALYQNGTFQSRDGKIWKVGVLHHLVSELLSIAHVLEGRMLDGELYVHGWKLQRINGAIAVNRNEPGPDTPHVEYHIFDVPERARPFSERWIEFSNTLRQHATPHIRVVDTSMSHSREELDRYFHLSTAEGYEGVMLRPDGPYELGETPRGTTKRSEYLWKYKQWEDDEFVCVGVTQGVGKAAIGIGALVCVAHQESIPPQPLEMLGKQLPTFSCGTGFSDEERIEYMRNPPIGKLVKVRYLCLSQDGIPLNPSFLCVMA